MDWTQSIDAYCERTDPGLWSEPLNALSNLAFLLAAVVMWRRSRDAGPAPRLLCAILFAIGLASGLWHTVARAWAGALDSAAIAVFILVYVYAANRVFLGWRRRAAFSGMLAVLPYAAAAGYLFAQLPFFAISAGYWPVALLIAGYAAALRHEPALARGLALGAGLLVLSLSLRSLDGVLCAGLPMGTHYLWHVLNALLLAWMIEVLRRHLLARSRARR